MLYREPKLLKVRYVPGDGLEYNKVSVLYREPKLLKGFLKMADEDDER